MPGLTENEARRACSLFRGVTWPDGVTVKVHADADAVTGVTTVVVRAWKGEKDLGLWRLSKPAMAATVRNLVAQVAVAADCMDDPDACDRPRRKPRPGGAERKEPTPTWLRATSVRVCALPKSLGNAVVVALGLLYDMEADDIPCPSVRSQGGRKVVIEWRHPVHGHRMEVACCRSGLVTITTQAKGMDGHTVECRTKGESVRESRRWIAWMYDEYGAERDEIEALLVVKK